MLTIIDLILFVQNPIDANLDGVIDQGDRAFVIRSLFCGSGPFFARPR